MLRFYHGPMIFGNSEFDVFGLPKQWIQYFRTLRKHINRLWLVAYYCSCALSSRLPNGRMRSFRFAWTIYCKCLRVEKSRVSQYLSYRPFALKHSYILYIYIFRCQIFRIIQTWLQVNDYTICIHIYCCHTHTHTLIYRDGLTHSAHIHTVKLNTRWVVDLIYLLY